MGLSDRVRRLAPSYALAIHYRYKEMLRQGKDVVSFGVGEPDFDTPAHIKKAGIEAIEQGYTKYSVTQGYPELREAICFLLKKRYGLEYEPAEVIVSVGGKHSIVNAMIALLNPGDEVLIPTPGWFSYHEPARLVDGVPVFIPTRKEEEFQLKARDVARRITPKTKLLILNTPNNPTGSMMEEEELAKIAALAVRHNFYIVSDEIYCEIVYDRRKHVSIALLDPRVKDRTITINGFSKAYAMTGWRVGYAAGPKEIISAMGLIQGHFTSGTNSMAQRAALAAVYGPQDFIGEMVREYDRRRRYIIERLNSIPGISCFPPHGTFYAFPNVSGTFGRVFRGRKIQSSSEFGDYLLDSEGVAVVPGDVFEGEGHLRLSFACGMEMIKSGCDRIERAVTV
jgi:aspartate aminotransferase